MDTDGTNPYKINIRASRIFASISEAFAQYNFRNIIHASQESHFYPQNLFDAEAEGNQPTSTPPPPWNCCCCLGYSSKAEADLTCSISREITHRCQTYLNRKLAALGNLH